MGSTDVALLMYSQVLIKMWYLTVCRDVYVNPGTGSVSPQANDHDSMKHNDRITQLPLSPSHCCALELSKRAAPVSVCGSVCVLLTVNVQTRGFRKWHPAPITDGFVDVTQPSLLCSMLCLFFALFFTHVVMWDQPLQQHLHKINGVIYDGPN